MTSTVTAALLTDCRTEPTKSLQFGDQPILVADISWKLKPYTSISISVDMCHETFGIYWHPLLLIAFSDTRQ